MFRDLWNPQLRKRALEEVDMRRHRSTTFTEPLKRAPNMKAFLTEFYKNVYTPAKKSFYGQELEKYADSLKVHYDILVPTMVSYEDFWQRYEWRCCDIQRVIEELRQADAVVSANNNNSKATTQSDNSTGGRWKHWIGDSPSKSNEAAQEASQKQKASPKAQVPKASSENSGEVKPQADGRSPKTGTSTRQESQKQSRPQAKAHVTDSDLIQETSQKQNLLATELSREELMDTKMSIDPSLCAGISLPKKTGNWLDKQTSPVSPKKTGNWLEKKKSPTVSPMASLSPKEKSKERSIVIEEEMTHSKKNGLMFVVVAVLFLGFISSMVVDQFVFPWLSLAVDGLCGPVRPGTVIDSTSLVLVSSGESIAPWWAPSLMKDSSFALFCRARPRLLLQWKVGKKKQLDLAVVNAANGQALHNVKGLTSMEIYAGFIRTQTMKQKIEEIDLGKFPLP